MYSGIRRNQAQYVQEQSFGLLTKCRTTGISVQRYVSTADLPEGDTAWLFLVHYR